MKEIKTGILLFAVLTILTGVIYPAAVTILAHLIFPKQSAGSIIYKADGTPSGSALIGQPFSGAGYFWSRPSTTADFPYNSTASGGSNLGPTNRKLINQVKDRVSALLAAGIKKPVPSDLVMASGSGLDPDISLEGAMVQVPRIAKERHLPEAEVRNLVEKYTEGRWYIFLTVPRVNVLKLNLALDSIQ